MKDPINREAGTTPEGYLRLFEGCLLLFFASIACLFVGHLGLKYWPNGDDAALKVLRRAGGRLEYQRTSRLPALSAVTDTPFYPQGDVWDVNLFDTELRGDVAKSLSGLHSLGNLSLYPCRVPLGMSASLIPPARDLTSLYINDVNVGDSHIKTLDHCPDLWFLHLDDTDVSFASIPIITRCRKLNVIYLRQNKISESGIAAIRKAFPKANLHFEL